MPRPNIEDAILLAARQHKGQLDKAGAPYILHPLRVMLDPQLKSETERMAAVLHDIVEDCNVTLDNLRRLEYADEVVDIVGFLTRRPEEEDDYDKFIRRISSGPELARKIKLADLRDNANLSRIANPTGRDHKRREKYLRAIEILEAAER